MKNIWILNHSAVTPDMSGGTRHYDFAKELIHRGHNVTIFASGFHYAKHKELKIKKNENYKIESIDGINFVWIKTFPWNKNNWRRILNMTSFMYNSYRIGKKISQNTKIGKPNIIIGCSVHLLTVLSAYWLSKYYKSKFIMEVRDLWPQTLIDLGELKKNSLIVKVLKKLEKFLYKKAQKIIVTMPLAKNYIVPLGIKENKIIWISNGIDLSIYKPIKEKKSKTEGIKILYSGTFAPVNHLSTILDSIKIIQDKGYSNIKFIFFGEGTEKEKLLEQKNKLKLKNTEFNSFVPKKNLPKMLNKANILIAHFKKSNVYKYGVSFNKLFDYMAMAKPIIFAVSVSKGPVNQTNCGISIPPENSEKMAEAIIKLYNMSPEEREKMGQRGREYVEKYHSIPVLVNKLEKVFREIND